MILKLDTVWRKTDFSILKHYNEILKKDKELNELARLLGKFRGVEKELEKVEMEQVTFKFKYKKEFAIKSELIGITESDDLNNVLPSEIAFLADKNTEIMFLKKFSEKKLQTFDYKGKLLDKEEHKIKTIAEKEKESEKGPIILCIDTSGSMQGTPEYIAKVISFAVLKTAIEDKRKCYLISFSTGIQTVDLTELNNSIEVLINFLSMSFHGGTDASPALNESLRMLKTENYKKADVLVISDFIMSGFPDNIKNEIEIQKKNDTKFHSLIIGQSGNGQVINNFTHNWVYDPSNPKGMINLINQLKEFKK